MTWPTFRDLVRQVTPPWLQTGTAEKILYAIGIQVDAMGEALIAGVKLRFPNVYSAESLASIGRERRIRRGAAESAASYAERLRRWLIDHQRRGGPHALLEQFRAYFLPATFPAHLFYPSGRRFVQDADGNITRNDIVGAVPSTTWAHWTLVLITDQLDGVSATDLSFVPREWNAAHCTGEVIAMHADAELWDFPPDLTWDGAGTWDTPDVTTRVAIT